MKYRPSEQHPNLDDQELSELATALRALSFTMWRGAEQQPSAAHSLPKQQFMVLSALSRGSRKMTDIANCSHTSQASLTGIVDRLEEHGYVRRKRSECDRRVVEVEATEEGLAIMKAANESFVKRLRYAVEPLAEEERLELLRLVRKIASRPVGGDESTC